MATFLENTVDRVIFACLLFREFLILVLFKKFGIDEFSFLFSGAIIIILFAKFLNSRVCPNIKTTRILLDLQYVGTFVWIGVSYCYGNRSSGFPPGMRCWHLVLYASSALLVITSHHYYITCAAAVILILPRKVKRLYLLTLEVNRYCLLALQSRIGK